MPGRPPALPSRSGVRVSLRHCGEALRARPQRAGERQLRRRAEIWHSSSPRRLLREPRRAGLPSWGSSSLRWEMAAGEYWKTSSGSSWSSTMEGRGFSGAAPLSGRGCRRAWGGGQGWSAHMCLEQAQPHMPCSASCHWHKPVGPAVAVGTGSSGRAPVERADGAGQHKPRTASWGLPRAHSCPCLGTKPLSAPLDNQTSPDPTHQRQPLQPHTGLCSPLPILLPLLLARHQCTARPWPACARLELSAPNPSPGSAASEHPTSQGRAKWLLQGLASSVCVLHPWFIESSPE